ncbi:MAG: hypothetical protein JRN52_01860 [Nitrososphaerota archaeon]|nr:hypothetical protein [Nitrososphaerota archaeon]
MISSSVGRDFELLVGDNPFHGISHLDQERAKLRSEKISDSAYAANLVKLGMENGASGFMFSVSETTLGVLNSLERSGIETNPSLWAIVPYAYEYVRYAVNGGMSGLGMRFGKQMIRSLNFRAMLYALSGFVRSDVEKIVRSLFLYELSRIRSATKKPNIKSLMLHEVITDMALALGLDEFFRSFVEFVSGLKITPGFETRNFAYLVYKFKEWKIDLTRVTIAAPFNNVGFQMSPTKEKCEAALRSLEKPNVVAMSVLASGYVKLGEALDYVSRLPNLCGVVMGVSNENQASQTFSSARDILQSGPARLAQGFKLNSSELAASKI